MRGVEGLLNKIGVFYTCTFMLLYSHLPLQDFTVCIS